MSSVKLCTHHSSQWRSISSKMMSVTNIKWKFENSIFLYSHVILKWRGRTCLDHFQSKQQQKLKLNKNACACMCKHALSEHFRPASICGEKQIWHIKYVIFKHESAMFLFVYVHMHECVCAEYVRACVPACVRTHILYAEFQDYCIKMLNGNVFLWPFHDLPVGIVYFIMCNLYHIHVCGPCVGCAHVENSLFFSLCVISSETFTEKFHEKSVSVSHLGLHS